MLVKSLKDESPDDTNTPKMKENLLVAILNNQSDFSILKEQCWYRIPVNSVDKFLKKRWPPKWIAFYQTKTFKTDPFLIKHFAHISNISIATRPELFPNEIPNLKSFKKYYRISFNKLETLPKPIISRRWRRIVFIQTTFEKFFNAVEINDLYDESPLEDRLWTELKRIKVQAERQELIQVEKRFYFLDFAIYCNKGKIDLETDGDLWHHNAANAAKDNLRNNDLSSQGWNILRFNSNQIKEQMGKYCIPQIAKNINQFGGIKY